MVVDDEEPAGVMGAGVAAGCAGGGVEPPLPEGAAEAGGWSPTTVVRVSMIGLLGSIIVKWI